MSATLCFARTILIQDFVESKLEVVHLSVKFSNFIVINYIVVNYMKEETI